ncbi:hypothetical protein SASPL_155028 [Salvia splendens]|uniref:PB1-like domain-containing protein n=1 Tax=Salvia splendens TaxID=180675 RepID=A0A8X8W128_SALSN|nr:hypothetical protein SASPL_155028 [Salvia splendens]
MIDKVIGGSFVGRYGFDPDKFGYFDIEEEVKKLGIMSWSKMCYKIPDRNLYVIIKSDKEVMQMLAYLSHRIRTEVVAENIGQNVGDNEESSCDIDVNYYPSESEESDNELTDIELFDENDNGCAVKERKIVVGDDISDDISKLLDACVGNDENENIFDYASSDSDVHSFESDDNDDDIGRFKFKNEDATTFIDDYYTVSRYLEGYRVGLEPIRGQRMWPEVEETTVKPPVIRRMSGRPKKKRRRAPEEKDPKFPKKKRSGVQMTCQNCHQQGHNSRSGKLHLRISYAPYIYFSLEYQQANG